MWQGITSFMVAICLCVNCSSNKPAVNSHTGAGSSAVADDVSPVVSKDILAREPVANAAGVKHILIGWRDLAEATGGRLHARAAQRSKKDAEGEVSAILDKLKAGADFDATMKEFSEDEGSAANAKMFDVAPDAGLVIEFRQLSMRLNVGEIGVCESMFGFHIIRRYR
jgi:hypothetical protein